MEWKAASSTAERTEAAPLVPLRRNRDFMLLWSGQVVSSVGSEITYVAYPRLVLALTDSPAKAGLTGFCVTIPWLSSRFRPAR